MFKKIIDNIPWWRTQYTENDALLLLKTFQNEHISLGPVTAEFENALAEKLNVSYVIAVNNGSAALLAALMAIGMSAGDEVIIPNRTWIAAAHAVKMLGGKPILIDVQPNVPIMDETQIESHLSKKTKAIIPTSLSGRAVQIEKIKEIAKKYRLHIIEDAAQAFLSRENNQLTGTQGDIGCFSLSTAKLLPTGQGGFLAVKDKALYHELRRIRTHGVDDLLECQFQRFGFNFRYTDLQAAIGLSQLNHIDEKISLLREVYDMYEAGLSDCRSVKLIPIRVDNGEIPLYIDIFCQDRAGLIQFLQDRHIQVKPYYPNLNRAKYFDHQNRFPYSDQFEKGGVTLPCGPNQSHENIKMVIDTIHQYEGQMV